MSDDEDMATGMDSDEDGFEFSYSDDDVSQGEAVEAVDEKASRSAHTSPVLVASLPQQKFLQSNMAVLAADPHEM